jgi:hypothetical protein
MIGLLYPLEVLASFRNVSSVVGHVEFQLGKLADLIKAMSMEGQPTT